METELKQASVDEARKSLNGLMTQLRKELGMIARARMANKDRGRRQETMSLLNDTYLRLVDNPEIAGMTPERFLAYASATIRNLLTDKARNRMADIRGGNRKRVLISDGHEPAAPDRPDRLLNLSLAETLNKLEEALNTLAQKSPRQCSVARFRLFSDMTNCEIAASLNVSVRLVNYELARAMAWLRENMDELP